MVEAPGTAPGSATIIPQDVYHHSRHCDGDFYIGIGTGFGKGQGALPLARVKP
jgi:hypothetical protein